MLFGNILTIAMTQATTTCRLTMDEVVINALIGIIDKDKVFELYAKTVNTFRQLNPKELKHLCL